MNVCLIIYKLLEKEYGTPKTALNFKTPIQLLVATILSAQSTDKTINKITPILFKKYKTAVDFAHADIKIFENDIRSSGFYHNKTKNIIHAAQKIISNFKGKVPSTMDGLLSLSGVARKTANVILQNAFGVVVGVAVDTHVIRLSNRLGFVKTENPVKIELKLMDIFPKANWKNLSNLLITHGRTVCNAKKPKCTECVISKYCPYYCRANLIPV